MSCTISTPSLHEQKGLEESQKVEQQSQTPSHSHSTQYLLATVVDAAPVLKTTDKSQSGFRIHNRFVFKEGGGLVIDCIYDGGQQKKCVVKDAYDGVPIFIANNEQLLLYDAGSGVYLSKDLKWSVSIGPSNDRISFSWEIKEKGESQISIDLRPLIQKASIDQSVEQIDQNRYRYSAHTEAGNRLKAIVNISGKYYESLSSWIQGEEFIILEVQVPGTDEQIPMSLFEFPQIPDQLETKPWQEFDNSRLLSDSGGMLKVMQLFHRHMYLREAIRRPAKRTEIEEFLGEEFDWIMLIKTDYKISSYLRSLIKQ